MPYQEAANPLGAAGAAREASAPPSDAEFRRVADSTPFMLTRCSRDLRYLFVNRAYAEMLGKRPDEIAGRRIVEVMGEEGLEAIRPHVEAVLEGRTVEYEQVVPFKGVGPRWLHVVYVPDQDASGATVGWIASIGDITARKRAEAEVESLAQFPEENPNPVLRASVPDGRVLYANRPASTLLDAMGGGDGGHLPGALLGAVRRAIDAGAAELEVAAPSGRVYAFTLFRSPGRGYVNLYGLDVTERKRAEEALREADRRKDGFLSVLSHELRNPLAPMRTAVHLLERVEPASDQARRAREVIARQVSHLSRLVDDLLDVTRIARDKLTIERARIDLGEVVRRAGEDHRSTMVAHGIDLAVSVPPEPVWVNGDGTRLTQLVGNLVQNALKFTEPGGHVAVALSAEAGAAVVRVRDDGIGISPALLPRVFEPFVQGSQDLARSDGGLGLGLALVKRLAQLHGGTVRAESAGPGHGAAFTVTLPRSGPPAAPSGEHRPAPIAGPMRRVLVVDDNRDAAASLAELVEVLGHRAEIALDGPAALSRARADPPDVVLCDVGLPGMSGYEVARRLRADPALDGTRLVAVTGYAQPDDLRRAEEAGFDRHLAKPLDPEALERLLA
jgi:PAS domain S-box-containing protein